MKIRQYNSPVVKLYIATQNKVIIAISFTPLDEKYLHKLLTLPALAIEGDHPDRLDEQLDLYFKGRDPRFSVKLALHGTDFQRKVWEACASIPFGETRTYGELAAMIGKPKAVRAVGAALGANPIPIIIPCHRVIGTNGTLTGFAGGLEVKQFLLNLEKM